MLIANNMLKALNEDATVNYKDDNDDLDFGAVLNFCKTPKSKEPIMCADGTKRYFSFD